MSKCKGKCKGKTPLSFQGVFVLKCWDYSFINHTMMKSGHTPRLPNPTPCCFFGMKRQQTVWSRGQEYNCLTGSS
ncbi:hypothetical protein XELAEV_18036964mg [Xenopus laevis]|uniref:Uncharacterized protein n=1 Tax=Xenopus laevis TaxID=8355 RepID=A0A974H9Y8_XENLA|nr:hypothetical protein XELAEV_18036964mg [Xenopus laevis]